MRSFRKCILVLIFTLIAVILISAIPVCYTTADLFAHDKETENKEKLAGQIDTLYFGMSQFQRAFDTCYVDELTGSSGYNCSGVLQTPYVSRLILEDMLEKNDIKLVVLEVSRSILSMAYGEYSYEGEFHAMPKLTNWSDRFSYLAACFHEADILTVYDKLMTTSRDYILARIQYGEVVSANPEDKGYVPGPIVPRHISEEEAWGLVNTDYIPEFKGYHLDNFREIVRMCRERGVQVIAMITPNAETKILPVSNLDEWHNNVVSLMNEMDIPFVDYNLYKKRFVEFTEEESFSDIDHLSYIGTKRFDEIYAEHLPRILSGEKIAEGEEFYSSYSEMLLDSPYAYLYK